MTTKSRDQQLVDAAAIKAKLSSTVNNSKEGLDPGQIVDLVQEDMAALGFKKDNIYYYLSQLAKDQLIVKHEGKYYPAGWTFEEEPAAEEPQAPRRRSRSKDAHVRITFLKDEKGLRLDYQGFIIDLIVPD